MKTPSKTNPDSDNGFLLRIAGKAAAIASVVALSLPLIGLGQAIGVVPGGINSDHYGNIADLTNAFNRPVATQTVQTETKPISFEIISEFYESYSGGAPYYGHRTNQLDDSAVGAYGAMGGLAGAGIMGAAGSAFAAAADKRRDNTANTVTTAAQATGESLTANKPLNLFMALDMVDGKPGPVTKGAAMGYAVVLAGMAVGLPTYLSGKSVYDNFIRDNNPAAPKPA